MGDIKYQLRKVGFPQCAKDSLQLIEQLIVSHNAGRNVIANSTELAVEVISEFVFCERKKTDNKGKVTVTQNINIIQELQLLEILCGYFSLGGGIVAPMVDPLAVRGAVFSFLFPRGDESRTRLLVRLVSMVIATRSRQVLTLAGTWLQQSGPTSPSGLALARSIVDDYLVLVPEAVDQLHDLPHLAFEFTANFLASVSELYGTSEGPDSLPSPALLQVVALWSSRAPCLCTAAVSSSMPPTTPFLGLVRWCIMAPLRGAEDSKEFSSLHLALLESVLSRKQDNLVTVQQLVSLIPPMMSKLPHAKESAVKQGLDRLVQIIIVLLRTGSVAGNLMELFKHIDALPKNELLECFAYNRNYVVSQPYLRLPTRM